MLMNWCKCNNFNLVKKMKFILNVCTIQFILLFFSSRWQKSDGNQFGNEIYSIEFQCDKNKPPLFNAKYNFHLEQVVNCPEFLVHPPTFLKLASKFGLELIMLER